MPRYEIPLDPSPQTFSIEMAGISYILTVWWNAAYQSWVLDLADSNKVRILSGLALVTGTDLFGQFGYLVLGGTLTVTTDGDLSAIPTFNNLGVDSHLYFTVA